MPLPSGPTNHSAIVRPGRLQNVNNGRACRRTACPGVRHRRRCLATPTGRKREGTRHDHRHPPAPPELDADAHAAGRRRGRRLERRRHHLRRCRQQACADHHAGGRSINRPSSPRMLRSTTARSARRSSARHTVGSSSRGAMDRSLAIARWRADRPMVAGVDVGEDLDVVERRNWTRPPSEGCSSHCGSEGAAHAIGDVIGVIDPRGVAHVGEHVELGGGELLGEQAGDCRATHRVLRSPQEVGGQRHGSEQRRRWLSDRTGVGPQAGRSRGDVRRDTRLSAFALPATVRRSGCRRRGTYSRPPKMTGVEVGDSIQQASRTPFECVERCREGVRL